MDKKKLKIYTGSSVGIDYFFFLTKTIKYAGFDVEPIFLINEVEYRKLAKSSGLKKIWLRIKMYIFYPIFLIYKGLRASKNSVFVISSNTFFAPILLRFILGFKSIKVVHMLYDLFPDALEIAGAIKSNSKVSKFIGSITYANLKKCEATVFLGKFLREHAEQRWGNSKKSSVIDISTDLSLYDNQRTSLIQSEKVIIHYGGQLGHLHDAKSIIECVKYVLKSDIQNDVEFNFYVSGAQASFLEESLKNYSVKIISAIPSSQWREDVKNFHIGLVSLSPGGASVCLPSKTYGMMAGGMSIFAICPIWSDLSRLVIDLDAGWVINNSVYDNHIELKDTNYIDRIKKERDKLEIANEFYLHLKEIINERELLEMKRLNAFNGVRVKHNIEILSEKWSEILNNV
ncbi:glycosyltransferase family protein [Pedobacter puniceum]|uniref:Glycosyltransferase n=1 Tax=Pedobacter puniceum TaxID=2666136 RepID=A0A7K0FSB9_9SPHI|nr:hypothetical protein [Pedobacter puniceum]MRX48663.1 hypothetical protein [Pedobacter puniceum]